VIEIETPNSALHKCKKQRKGGLGSKQGHRKIYQESKMSILRAIKLPCVKTN